MHVLVLPMENKTARSARQLEIIQCIVAQTCINIVWGWTGKQN